VTLFEALALLYSVLTLGPKLVRQQVAFRSDATAVVSFLIHQASPSPALNVVSLYLHAYMGLIEARTSSAVHLPGIHNHLADLGSRQWLPGRSTTGWPLLTSALNRALLRLSSGRIRALPPDCVDLFASSGNSQCRRFFSYRPDPLAEATDAFSHPLSRLEVIYANPPFGLVALTVSRLLQEWSSPSSRIHTAVLVAPDWPATPWHHALLDLPSSPTFRRPLRMTSLFLDPASSLEFCPTTNLPEPMRNPAWGLRVWLLQRPPPS